MTNFIPEKSVIGTSVSSGYILGTNWDGETVKINYSEESKSLYCRWRVCHLYIFIIDKAATSIFINVKREHCPKVRWLPILWSLSGRGTAFTLINLSNLCQSIKVSWTTFLGQKVWPVTNDKLNSFDSIIVNWQCSYESKDSGILHVCEKLRFGFGQWQISKSGKTMNFIGRAVVLIYLKRIKAYS